jgi:hypothetical protein
MVSNYNNYMFLLAIIICYRNYFTPDPNIEYCAWVCMFSRAKYYVDTVRREVGKKVFRKPFPIGRITERSSTLMSLLLCGSIYVCVCAYTRLYTPI